MAETEKGLIRSYRSYSVTGPNCPERGQSRKLKTLMNQWRSRPSSHDQLSHQLAFTKNA
jgi:hypothetical protein